TVKVWCPLGSALESPDVDHAPPLAVVFAFATSVGPSKTCTTTSVFSLAVPENEGLVSLDGVLGCASVSTGASVSTSKVTSLPLPSGLPESPLFSVACAGLERCQTGSWLAGVSIVNVPS